MTGNNNETIIPEVGFPNYPSAYCKLGNRWIPYVGRDKVDNENEGKKWFQTLAKHFEEEPRFFSPIQFKAMYATEFCHRNNRFFSALFSANSMPVIGQIEMINPIHDRTTVLNWLPCQGQVMPRKSYPALWSLIGYTYGGSGDYFNLPDLRDRQIIGHYHARTIGESFGANEALLTSKDLPKHKHSITINASKNHGTIASPQTNYLAKGADGVYGYSSDMEEKVVMSPFMIEVLKRSGGIKLDIKDPCLSVNYFINLVGYFPNDSSIS